MKKKISVVSIFFISVFMPVSAADLYKQYISKWGSQVSEIKGREFKFLIDPNKVDNKIPEAFKDIWFQSKEVLKKNGLILSERSKKTWNLKHSVKIFFDTPNMDLWKKGYLIRVTMTNHKNDLAEVTVKRINLPLDQIVRSSLSLADSSQKVAVIEDNVSVGKQGQLVGYTEKAISWRMKWIDPSRTTLADFDKYIPELSYLELSPDTKLVPYRVFSIRCRPGFVEIPGLKGHSIVSMEAWSHTMDGKPFVYDFSFGYEGEFTNLKEVHDITEKAFESLFKELGDRLGYSQASRYKGSKVRVLLNQPK